MNHKKPNKVQARAEFTPAPTPNSVPVAFWSGNRRRASRKDLQLCKQVQRTLQLTLGDFGDEVLSGLVVEAVVPAPNAAQLLVVVQPLMPADQVTVGETLKRLHTHVGQMRNEVARAINRKKTPQLLFQVNSTPLTSAESTAADDD